MTAHLTPADRPSWPRRAVVTAGMPYGNKGLHFGHVGGVFVPADFFAVCGYLLYICLYTGGRWFLSFAFPVVMLFCVVTTASIALFRYVRRGKLFITGGLLVAIGGSTMLVELFQHITFGTQMFHWSLYTASVFAWAGFFLILSGIIRPLREYLERKFFL